MLRAAETITRTDTGLQRGTNEDSAWARPPLFVVADGMGGAQAGEVASQLAVEVFQQDLPAEGPPEERLVACAREANRRIHELAQARRRDLGGMGTTLTAAYLDGGELAIAHVGDSRAYLFRDGSLRRLTQDHTLVGALVRDGKLTEAQAAEHPQRSIITRALGPEPEVEVDTWTYPLRGGDVILLCSDGLTSMIDDEEVTGVMAAAGSLDEAARGLIAAANAAGGRDNITVVVFRAEDVGGDVEPDQPTLVGMAPPEEATLVGVRPPASEPPAGADQPANALPHVPPESRGDASVVTMMAPAVSRPAPAAAMAAVPSQRGADSEQRRRARRGGRAVAALVAVLAVVFLIGGGGWLATRQLYFIGANGQGLVTIFRGLPYDLPAGIRLYESFYVSGIPASTVADPRRKELLDHRLRSRRDASGLVRELELGRLSAR